MTVLYKEENKRNFLFSPIKHIDLENFFHGLNKNEDFTESFCSLKSSEDECIDTVSSSSLLESEEKLLTTMLTHWYGNYELHSSFNYNKCTLLGIPEGAKSRVETQTVIYLQFKTNDIFKKWSYIVFPHNSTGKLPKLKLSLEHLAETIYLEAFVTCASEPTRKVQVCDGCVIRERKRLRRAKSRRKLKIDSPISEEERGRIIIFNCRPIEVFSNNEHVIPTRITCYCRHHNEQRGFRIYFVLKDWKKRILAATYSPPLLITDDHKTKASGNKKKYHKKGVTDLLSKQSISDFSLFNEPLKEKIYNERWFNDVIGYENPLLCPHLPEPFPLEETNSTFSKFSPLAKAAITGQATKDESRAGCTYEYLYVSERRKKKSARGVKKRVLNAGPDIRLIPAEGPAKGGYPVALVGFDLPECLVECCMFGEELVPWEIIGGDVLVCIAPERKCTGAVAVVVRYYSWRNSHCPLQSPPILFVYT